MSAIPASRGALLGQTKGSTLLVGVHGDNSIAQHRLLPRSLDDDSNVRVVTRPGVRLVVFLSRGETVTQGPDRKLQSGIRGAIRKAKSHVAAVLAFAAVTFGSADLEKERLFDARAGGRRGGSRCTGGAGRRRIGAATGNNNGRQAKRQKQSSSQDIPQSGGNGKGTAIVHRSGKGRTRRQLSFFPDCLPCRTAL